MLNNNNKLNSIIAVEEFYFFCSHCEYTNDDFTAENQIFDGIKCDSCKKENYFEENK